MGGVHALEHTVGVFALNNFVNRDGLSQPIEEDRNYARFTEAGIEVAKLERIDDGSANPSTYSEEDLTKLGLFVGKRQILTCLEERPLEALRKLETNNLPPIVVNLYRSSDHKSGVDVERLLKSIDEGIVAGCTVDSDASRETYIEKGVSPAAIRVIQNGIDIERFKPSEAEVGRVRRELTIDATAPTVLFIGRDSPEKDVPLFVKSARKFLEAVPDGHVIMCGPGLTFENKNMANLINMTLDDPNILARFHAIGMRPDLPAVYAAAQVLSITSMTESSPLCISEAKACGLGVFVSTEVGDAPSMIDTHGLITSRDPIDIANAWREAYAKRGQISFPLERREELGTGKMIAQYERVLRELAA
jgi:glycosyltransferase involved in cell wall biosynthesis